MAFTEPAKAGWVAGLDAREHSGLFGCLTKEAGFIPRPRIPQEARRMKKFLILCTGLAFALTTATALAADLTGTWSGEMPGQNGGTFHISYTFKQDGAKLTGFVKSPQGDLIQIAEGKIDGDKVSFNLTVNGTTILHEGTISGDTIKLNTTSDDAGYQGGDLTLTRDHSQ
ncbi:MAG: hypothetical protein ABSE36_18455 [Terracidiphilus sp.]|jgi:hypothetical protein